MTLRSITTAALALGALAITGCKSHLLFVEEDHIGLKATFEANNPSPVQVTVGYRRGIVAVIPQKLNGQNDAAPATKPEDKPAAPLAADNPGTNSPADSQKTTITIQSNPNELMSLYSTFSANIGFNEPVQITHFLATGSAAATLLAKHEYLRDLTDSMKKDSASKGGGK